MKTVLHHLEKFLHVQTAETHYDEILLLIVFFRLKHSHLICHGHLIGHWFSGDNFKSVYWIFAKLTMKFYLAPRQSALHLDFRGFQDSFQVSSSSVSSASSFRLPSNWSQRSPLLEEIAVLREKGQSCAFCGLSGTMRRFTSACPWFQNQTKLSDPS